MKKIHRFFIVGPLKSGRQTLVDRAVSHQIVSVLRLQPGEEVILLDGSGMEQPAVIAEVRGKEVEVAVGALMKNAAEPYRRVTLCCAVLKREHFEWVAQKATECGVSAIVPVITARTVKLGVKTERLRVIAKEAAEQSGRGVVPEVSEPMNLERALADAASAGRVVFFDVSGEPLSEKNNGAVSLFIGPEGGWDENEVALAREKGAMIANLGPRMLRAETAATVVTWLFGLK